MERSQGNNWLFAQSLRSKITIKNKKGLTHAHATSSLLFSALGLKYTWLSKDHLTNEENSSGKQTPSGVTKCTREKKKESARDLLRFTEISQAQRLWRAQRRGSRSQWGKFSDLDAGLACEKEEREGRRTAERGFQHVVHGSPSQSFRAETAH